MNAGREHPDSHEQPAPEARADHHELEPTREEPLAVPRSESDAWLLDGSTDTDVTKYRVPARRTPADGSPRPTAQIAEAFTPAAPIPMRPRSRLGNPFLPAPEPSSAPLDAGAPLPDGRAPRSSGSFVIPEQRRSCPAAADGGEVRARIATPPPSIAASPRADDARRSSVPPPPPPLKRQPSQPSHTSEPSAPHQESATSAPSQKSEPSAPHQKSEPSAPHQKSEPSAPRQKSATSAPSHTSAPSAPQIEARQPATRPPEPEPEPARPVTRTLITPSPATAPRASSDTIAAQCAAAGVEAERVRIDAPQRPALHEALRPRPRSGPEVGIARLLITPPPAREESAASGLVGQEAAQNADSIADAHGTPLELADRAPAEAPQAPIRACTDSSSSPRPRSDPPEAIATPAAIPHLEPSPRSTLPPPLAAGSAAEVPSAAPAAHVQRDSARQTLPPPMPRSDPEAPARSSTVPPPSAAPPPPPRTSTVPPPARPHIATGSGTRSGTPPPPEPATSMLRAQLQEALTRARNSELRLAQAELRARRAAMVAQANEAATLNQSGALPPLLRSHPRPRSRFQILVWCAVCFSVGGYVSLLWPIRQQMMRQDAALRESGQRHTLAMEAEQQRCQTEQQRLETEKQELTQKMQDLQALPAGKSPPSRR
jgi:hypothetical protein